MITLTNWIQKTPYCQQRHFDVDADLDFLNAWRILSFLHTRAIIHTVVTIMLLILNTCSHTYIWQCVTNENIFSQVLDCLSWGQQVAPHTASGAWLKWRWQIWVASQQYANALIVLHCYYYSASIDNQATTPFSYCSSMVFHHVQWQYPNATRNSFPWENWRRPPGCPCTMWMKTIQQDLKYDNLSLNEATDMAQNRPLCGDWCARLVLRTASGAGHKKEEEEIRMTTRTRDVQQR